MKQALSEELVELLDAALQELGFRKVLAEGHVGQLGLLPLDLKKTRLNGVLDDELDRGDRTSLPESVLRINQFSSSMSQIWYHLQYDLPLGFRPQGSCNVKVCQKVPPLFFNHVDIPIRIHQVDALSGGKVQTDTTGFQTDKQNLTARIMLQGFHSAGSLVSFHRTIKTIVAYLCHLQRILDPLRICQL